MVVSKHNILGLFHAYNKEYFDGWLPLPIVDTMNSYRTLGEFSCTFSEDGFMENETIKISANYDFTEEQLRNVLVHEMIHMYLVFIGEDMHCKHGKAFKRMAKRFNSEYGMNITKKIDLTEYKVREGKSNFMKTLSTFF